MKTAVSYIKEWKTGGKKWQTDKSEECGCSYPDVVEGCFVGDVVEKEES